MPFSVFFPLGLLLMIAGVIAHFESKRQRKIWLVLIHLGGFIALGTLGVIILTVNSM